MPLYVIWDVLPRLPLLHSSNASTHASHGSELRIKLGTHAHIRASTKLRSDG